jgi:hypothetical protein
LYVIYFTFGGIAMFEKEDLETETQAWVDHRRRSGQWEAAPRAGKGSGHKPYTPQFSPLATVTVRRLAWALHVSMPKAVDRVVNALPAVFSPLEVCPLCKDTTKCGLCAFSQPSAAAPAVPAV